LGPDGEAPPGYKKIRCHIIYDVKHDGRHKARIVAGIYLTDPNTESVYSGVVSLRGIRLIVFPAELNGLELWGADVGNAYLEAKTKEKVYIVAGLEFCPMEGHTLLIDKALYGLRSSGLCWHQRVADVLRDIGFTPSMAEADIWMREGDGV
jgi:Reverse transcriptase (RNA-dependent DNA polymerase)